MKSKCEKYSIDLSQLFLGLGISFNGVETILSYLATLQQILQREEESSVGPTAKFSHKGFSTY